MSTLASPARIETAPQSRWLARTQDAAIFAASANLFSTALANVGLVLFVLMFIRVLLGPERRSLAWDTFPRGVAMAIGLYLAWQAIGIAYSDAPFRYAFGSLWSDRKILYILPLALLFGAEAPRRRFLAAFLVVNTAALLLSYVLYFPDAQNLLGRLPTRVLHSHVTQGMSFAMACFLSLWYLTQSTQRRWRLAFLLLAGAFLLNIVVLTAGRSGYVVFLVLVVAAFGVWKGPKGVAVGLAAAAVLAVSIFLASDTVRARIMKGVYEAQNYQTAKEENSLGIRMLLYRTTLDMIAEHPVLGGGTGSFKGRFTERVSRHYSDWRAKPFHDPHNQYLFVWVENGIAGLATFVLLLVALYRACDKRSSYGQMAAGCLLAWCVTSLFSGHFRTFPEAHIIVFVLGVLMLPLSNGASPRVEATPA